MIVLVRYSWEGDILKDFVFCKEMLGRTSGEELFKLLDAFMTEAGLSWEKYVAVSTDVAAAMTGRKSGVGQSKDYCDSLYAASASTHLQKH